MPSFNRTILCGNLTRDPELKYTQNGTAVCEMGIAVNRKYTVNGERREDVLFMDCVAWSKLAEACGEHCSKGMLVLLEGRLTQQNWEDRNTGQKRSKIELVVESAQFLSFPDGGRDSGRRPQPAGATKGDEDQVPF